MDTPITIGSISLPPAVIVAIIAAIASIIAAGISFVSTMKNTHMVAEKNRELETHKNRLVTELETRKKEFTTELEAYKDTLVEKQEERKARRDYQYEARKHLYQQYEPLLFQLVEQCEIANARIYSLARMARLKNLGRGGWLSGNSHYAISTIYFLLSPLVIVKLMQRSLTFVDLTVDLYLNDQYLLAKQLYWSFTDAFDFARKSQIDYDPDSVDAYQQREQCPEKYWAQGIPVGRLDKAVEACITHDPNEISRCMSFGEFEEAYMSPSMREKFDYLSDIFFGFHPKTRPILWRILITQAHIHETLLSTHRIKLATLNENSTPKLTIKPLSVEARRNLDWRHSPDEGTDEEVLQQPFEVAYMYLQNSFVQHLLC